MENKNYCKFKNTLKNMEECLNALEKREEMSREEQKTAKEMFIKILEFCEEECIILGYGEQGIDALLEECEEE